MKSKMTYQQKKYNELVDQMSPQSNIIRDCFRAFWVGGFICCVGQAINELIMFFFALSEKDALTWTSIVLIFLGSILTGAGIYSSIGKYAGAGSIVPITGFSNSIVASAIEFKQEGLVMGVGSKLFTVAGPVIVYGISTSIIAGIIFYVLNYCIG